MEPTQPLTADDIVQPKHITQKVLKQIAADIADECHKHYGCVASNRRMVYGALRLIQDRTKAANNKLESWNNRSH